MAVFGMKQIIIITSIIITLFILNIASGQSGYVISGKIVDDQQKPLAGANIFVPEFQSGTVSADDGTYRLEKLKKGRVKIQFSFIGYKTLIKDTVISDEDLVIDIMLYFSTLLSQEVVVSGGRPSSQHETALKVETIKLTAIKSTANPSLMKSIANIPGVDVISKGSGVTSPVIRGLSTSNILVLNNGIRLENYQFSANHPYLIDEFGTDRVEVIKGPASLIYGPNAIGGVINFIREKPANSGSITGDANLQYYSNTNGVTANLGIKGTGNKLFWGVRGGMKSNMDYLQGSGNFVPNTRFNQASIKTFGGLRTKSGFFRIYYDYIKMKAGMCVLPVIPVITERGRKNRIWYQDLDMHLVASQNTFYHKDFKLQANLAYQNNHRRLKGDETEPQFTLVDTKLNTFNYEVKSDYAPSVRFNFIMAIQGMYQQNKNQEAPEHVLPDYALNDIGLSAMSQLDQNQVHLQVGLRFDNRIIDVPEQEMHGHHHGEGEHEEDEPEGQVFEPLHKYYGNISGSIGLTYEWSDQFLLRVNLASAYRTPNIAELTQDGVHGTRYEQGNRDLTSQRNYEADLNLHYHSRSWMFDIAGYYNFILEYIFLAPTSDTTSEGQFIYRYLQNDASIYGLEAIIEALAMPELNIKGTFSYIRGRQSDGDNLPFIPQNKLKIDIKWLRKELWELGNFYIRAGMGIAMDQDEPALFETKTGGYLLCDAGVGFSIKTSSGPIQFDIVATNIFNKQYIDHLSTLKELGYQDPGLNVMVNINVPFSVKK